MKTEIIFLILKFRHFFLFVPLNKVIDHYKILGITSDAEIDRIRRAYLEKVRLVHPDINPSTDAHKEFILLKEAYDILINENSRMVYDMKIKQAATTKQNIKNFHYDFKSNLGVNQKEAAENNSKPILFLVILIAMIALIGSIMALLLNN